MEEAMKWEQVSLIGELIQGKELAKQLCTHLLSSSSSSSQEENEVLIEKILSSYEKALSMLNRGETKIKKGDSNCSFTGGSPRSEVLDRGVKHNDAFKKRKNMPRWTNQVKICPETGLEGSLDDGYSWRKYGQKDILGSKFPRGYYRCTHRNVQGCLATKQVQRSDEDPTVLEINYIGRHTCTQASHLNKAFPSKRKLCLVESQPEKHQKTEPQEDTPLDPEAFFNFETEVQVKTEDLDTREDIFPSFCFTSPSIGSENEDSMFISNSMMENNFMESLCCPLKSPPVSESNMFCLNVQTSESDVTDIVSAPTSVCNSPIADLDLSDFELDFTFNTPEHFFS